LYALAAEAGRALLDSGLTVVTAESCTGGGVASALTDVPGSSRWFERGYVTYSNQAKQDELGVGAGELDRHGAVSAEVVAQMAAGALRRSGAQVAVAISGVAGPDGGTSDKPVGLVWFATARPGVVPRTQRQQFSGNRAAVRQAAVQAALRLIIAAARKAA
jgi:nicotinamide-nucleotide amidase